MTDEQRTRTHATASPFGIPMAILLAAVIIAGAIIYTSSNKTATVVQQGNPLDPAAQQAAAEVEPVTEKDHIRGNPNAPFMIVEYSDYDCPFCQRFHEYMNQAMTEYGRDGKIAWVYRHSPLPSLHPNAPKIAEAAECVAELGGNEAFWKFSDLVFTRTLNTPTNMLSLPSFAGQAGVDADQFTSCLESGRYTAAIQEDMTLARKAGVTGTPHSYLIAGDQKVPMSGVPQDYATFKQMLDSFLAQLEVR